LSPGDPSGTAVWGQISDPREAAIVLAGTAADDDFVGTVLMASWTGAGAMTG